MKLTVEEIEAKIIDMVKAGVPQGEIRSELNIGAMRLHNTIRKHGLQSTSKYVQKWTDREVDILKTMYLQQGLTPSKIFKSGALPGRTKEAIQTQCWKYKAEEKAKEQQAAPGPHRMTEAEIKAKLAEIPVDTRSKTARLMGDPIPNDPRRVAA